MDGVVNPRTSVCDPTKRLLFKSSVLQIEDKLKDSLATFFTLFIQRIKTSHGESCLQQM